MSSSSTPSAATPPKTQPRTAAAAKGSTDLSREAIADHLAAFRKNGGRIEILGTTPLRASVPPASRGKSAAQPKVVEKKA
jgi:hypothetical protein